MMEKIELRFWDVITPVLTQLQGQIYRVRKTTSRTLNVLPAWFSRSQEISLKTLLPTILVCAFSGFLTGTIFYLALYAAVRF